MESQSKQNDHKNLEKQIAEIIHQHFQDYPVNDIQVTHLAGLTNQTFKISCLDKPALVYRKFSQMGDRQMQNRIFVLLQKQNIAPKCYFANKTYRIQLFIENCRHPHLSQLKNENVQKKIMNLLYKYHNTQIHQIKQKSPFYEYVLSTQYYQKVLSYQNIKNDKNFYDLQTQFKQPFKDLNSLKQKTKPERKQSIKFCHNDLNNLNIFIQPQIFFIDFEYSSYNYISYDIANFLNQSTINYLHSQFPFFALQRSIEIDQVRKICSFYPSKYQNIEIDVLRGLAVCNLYWAGWSLIMANDPSQKGFGTIQHGLMRMKQFNHYLDLVQKFSKTQIQG